MKNLYEFIKQLIGHKINAFIKGAGVGCLSSGVFLFSNPFNGTFIIEFVVRLIGVLVGTFLGGLGGLLAVDFHKKYIKKETKNKNDVSQKRSKKSDKAA